jgi:hypothetical protein
MAKIALCITGQTRCVEAGYEYHKNNIINGNEVTVFVHTWESPNTKKVFELYKPEAMMVEESINPDLSKYTRVPPPQPNWKVKNPALSTYAQLYAIKKCNELKSVYEEDNNMTFDWVIRSRFDFAINVRIPFYELDNSKLYIPNCRMTPQRDFGNDQFAFSSSENMNKYAKAFDFIDQHYDRGTQMMCEDLMSENWKHFNMVGENLVYCNINHPFPPGPYNGTWHSLLREDFEQWAR